MAPKVGLTGEEMVDLRETVEALRRDLEESKVQMPAQSSEALSKVRAELQESISALRESHEKGHEHFKEAVGTSNTKLEELVAKRIGPLEEARKDLTTRTAAAEGSVGKLEARAAGLEATAAALKAMHDELRSACAAADADVRSKAAQHAEEVAAKAAGVVKSELQAARAELQERIRQLQESSQAQLRACESRLDALASRVDQQLRESAEAQRQALERLGEALRGEAAALERRVREAAASELARAEAARQECDAQRGGQIQALEADARKCFDKLDEHEKRHERSEEEARLARAQDGATLQAAQQETGLRLQAVEAAAFALRATCAELGGVTAKQVEWQIDDAQRRVELAKAGADPDDGVWLSPKFEAVGASGLQLELRVLRPEESSKSTTGSLQAYDDSPDCSIFLRAAPGLRLAFRLYVGGESIQLKHSFDGELSCGSKRFCNLAEQVSKSDGALRVGVEFFEATRHVVLEDAPSGPTVNCLESGGSQASSTGSLRLQHYLNHRLFELIQHQVKGIMETVQRKVDLVRSRSISRVQWRLEGAFALRQNFPPGKPLCSTAFQAVGVSGMQLVFYPSGCVGAREGFCSFFLSCPAGTALRCWLWAGRWRREARPEPLERQDLIGRVNFCRFENCVNPVDESIDLALEIEEAQQITRDSSMSQRQTPRGSSLMPQAPGAASPGPSQHLQGPGGSELERMDISTLRTERKATRALQQQDHVKQLPAIWTSQTFHTFAEAKSARAATTSSMTSRGNDSMLLPAAPSMSEGQQPGVGPSDSTPQPPLPTPPPTAVAAPPASGARPTTTGSGASACRPVTRGSRAHQKYKEYLPP